MFLKFLLLLITFKIRIIFSPPPRKKYLFYHKASSFIKDYLDIGSYNILHTKLDEFNLYIFLKSLFNFKKVKKLSTRYVLTYIKHVSPKFVISSIDNQLSTYNIKKFFKNIKIIAIQNGIRSFGNEGFELDIDQNMEYLKKKNLSCDFFFIMGKKYEKVFSQFVKCKFINSGSIKSNMCSIGKNTNNDVVFISQYAPHRMDEKGYNYRITDEIVLKNIVQFCEQKNLKCFIFLRVGNVAEKNYYKSILKNHIKFVHFHETYSNEEKFNFLDTFKLIVTVDSTIGYEMISRNKKVLLVSARDQFLIKDNEFRKLDFGFIYGDYYLDQGPFWMNKFSSEQEILKKINEVYSYSDEKIIKEYKSYKDALFYSDQDNIKLREILNEKIL